MKAAIKINRHMHRCSGFTYIQARSSEFNFRDKQEMLKKSFAALAIDNHHHFCHKSHEVQQEEEGRDDTIFFYVYTHTINMYVRPAVCLNILP
jgi:hypothetical protein